MKAYRTSQFEQWLLYQSPVVQALIESRVFRIEKYDHFGDARYLGDGLSELRWRNGLRIYFARVEPRAILLLIGGGKNDQKQDIKKARILLEGYADP